VARMLLILTIPILIAAIGASFIKDHNKRKWVNRVIILVIFGFEFLLYIGGRGDANNVHGGFIYLISCTIISVVSMLSYLIAFNIRRDKESRQYLVLVATVGSVVTSLFWLGI